MKTIILLFLSACACFAQYRGNTYTLASTGTNTVLLANTNVTYNAAAQVAAGNSALIQLSYTLTTNDASGTNPVIATFHRSFDGTRWDGSFTFTVSATTNSEAWARTNITVTNDFYLRLTSITNGNAWSITNLTLRVGQKVGL